MRVPGVADITGAVLAGRYRLLGTVGTGASGRVYIAWDSRLRRRVAVKVLHPALAEDLAFLRRFEAEAQLAASLHHPNIVTVFDWGAGPSAGDDDELPFIVLELLSGGSLRALLDSGARLSPAQASQVGRQVAGALAYAHGRGFVHRDVKPANLLFDERGTAKVADFGLVRALAEASWTEPAGAVLGTARYAAPEQLQGRLDARADQYALALALVEAVTGEVPFAGETSLSGLLARVDRDLAVPEVLGPLAPVVARAGAADPDRRWGSAAAFAKALSDAAALLPGPEPLPLVGVEAPAAADAHPTEIHTGGPLPAPTARTPSPAPAPPPKASANPGRARARRSSSPLVPLLVVLLLVAGAAGALFAANRAGGTPVRVPNLVSLPETEARQAATGAGFEVEIRREHADDPAGTVIDHDPAPGRLLNEGRPVRLVVSSGPRPVPLPGVTGRSLDEARGILEGAGFEVSSTEDYDENVPEGSVAVQEPVAGEEVAPGGAVRLVVSQGPRPVEVPDVVGRSFEEAKRLLGERRFSVERRDVHDDDVPPGVVIRSDPGAGTEADRDSSVRLVVSLGPDLVEVPDVVGEDVDDAIEALEEDGFEVDVFGYRRGRSVDRQNPAGGERLRRGGTVSLFF